MSTENNELVSIVIPFYKVRKEYWLACLDSIINQTYSEWEIILIDDGNPDDIKEWLYEFQSEKIKIFTQNNCGVSAARNNGISRSMGGWIYFCDPDDLMYPNELERLHKVALQTDSDISICSYTNINLDTFETVGTCNYDAFEDSYKCIVGSDVDGFIYELLAPNIMRNFYGINFNDYAVRFPWGHLYKKSILREIEFPLGLHPGEDKIFNIQVTKAVDKIVFLNEKLHFYRTGYGVTGKYNTNALENSKKTTKIVKDLLQEKKEENVYKYAMGKMEADQISYLAKNYFFHRDNDNIYDVRMTELNHFLEKNIDYFPKYVVNGLLTWKQKIFLLLLRLKLYKIIEYIIRM